MYRRHYSTTNKKWISCNLFQTKSSRRTVQIINKFIVVKNSTDIISFMWCRSTKSLFINYLNVYKNKWKYTDSLFLLNLVDCQKIYSIAYNKKFSIIFIYYEHQFCNGFNALIYGKLNHDKCKIENKRKTFIAYKVQKCSIEFVNVLDKINKQNKQNKQNEQNEQNEKNEKKLFEIHLVGPRTLYGELEHLTLGYQKDKKKNKCKLYVNELTDYFDARIHNYSSLIFIPLHNILMCIGDCSINYFCLQTRQWFRTNIKLSSLYISAAFYAPLNIIFIYQQNSPILLLDISDITKINIIQTTIKMPIYSLNAKIFILNNNETNEILVHKYCNYFYNYQKFSWYKIPNHLEKLIFRFFNNIFLIFQRQLSIWKTDIAHTINNLQNSNNTVHSRI